MDIHVPTLERMYHKRIKGYGELGYQVRFGASDEPVSVIYGGHTFTVPFEQDLTDAGRSIIVVSPGLQKGRLIKLLLLLQKAQTVGVEIILHTKAVDVYDAKYQESVQEAITMAEKTGIAVHTHKELQRRYAVIDRSIVWYGSVDFLAFGRKDMDVIRFVNPDIAGELLAFSGEAEYKQLMLTDSSI